MGRADGLIWEAGGFPPIPGSETGPKPTTVWACGGKARSRR